MTKAKREYLKSYCSEPLDKIEHYEEALADNFAGWCMHHRKEIKKDGTRVSAKELIDQGLYFHRPASELIFMRFGEHSALHNKGRTLSNEHRKKISESRKGSTLSEETRLKMSEALSGENHPFFGKHHTEKTLQKMSEAICGMLYWNNGISSKRSRECPGEGWTRGRLRFK